MKNSLSNIFKSLKGSYNLLDLAQKKRGKPLPRTRASYNEEYKILNDYKKEMISKKTAIEKLIAIKNIDHKEAKKILENITNHNITPMKLK